MSRILTVVAAQVRPVPFDPAATLQKFEDEVHMLRGGFPDADLYIFPELYLTGEHPFAVPPSGFDEDAAADPGTAHARRRDASPSARVGGSWPAPSSSATATFSYNTAVVFGPSGRLVARYRKIFTWRPFEPYAVGTEAPPVFSIPNVGKVGLMICYDGWFPEMARGLALPRRRGDRASDAHVDARPRGGAGAGARERDREPVLRRSTRTPSSRWEADAASASTPRGACCSRRARARSSSPRSWTSSACRTVRERGTRGLNRLLHHVRDAPRAAFSAYDDLGRD